MCVGPDPDRKLYVCDHGGSRVQVFNMDWSLSHIIDGPAYSGDGNFIYPTGLAFDPSGHLHVCSYGSDKVVVFTSQGQFVRCYSCTSPYGIAIDKEGYSLVSSRSGKICIFSSQGNLVHTLTGLRSPDGIAIAPDGSIWVCEYGNNRLVRY